MNYARNLATEREGTDAIIDYITAKTGASPLPITDKLHQLHIGDLLASFSKLGPTSIELKIEKRYTGNIFAETWSNREWGRPGWLHTSQSNQIWFYWLDTRQLVASSTIALREWLLRQDGGTIDSYRQVKAGGGGRNDTYGAIVPISDLRAARLEQWHEATL